MNLSIRDLQVISHTLAGVLELLVAAILVKNHMVTTGTLFEYVLLSCVVVTPVLCHLGLLAQGPVRFNLFSCSFATLSVSLLALQVLSLL